MCRSIVEGGRRCPHHELTNDERNALNARRRINYQNVKEETVNRMVQTLTATYTFNNEIPLPYDPRLPEHKNFVGRYTRARLNKKEESALYDYTTMDFKKIRQNLYRKDESRNVTVSFPKEVREKLKAKMELLDNILARAPKARKPLKLYRGGDVPEHVDVNTWLEEHYPVGGIWSDKTYLSTSADVSMAARFPNKEVKSGRKLMIEIISDGGLPIPGHAGFMGDEYEVLFPRKTKFVVAEVLKDHEYKWHDLTPRDGHDPEEFLRTRKVTLIRLIDTSLHKGDK